MPLGLLVSSRLPSLDIEPFASRDARNDYELPWILRGVMDSTTVRELFQAELDVLKDGILDWRPSTKALKDIKKRVSVRIFATY